MHEESPCQKWVEMKEKSFIYFVTDWRSNTVIVCINSEKDNKVPTNLEKSPASSY